MDLAFLNFALLTFSAIFVIVDPPGVVPLFVALTANDSEEKKRRMARRACLVAWSVLTVFALAGTWILELFGITLYGFKVAGGLLMLVTAYDQLRAERPRTRSTAHEEEEGVAKEDVSVVPLAMPVLAGPGAIATSMVMMSRAQGFWQDLVVILAITATILVAYGMLYWSERLAQMLGTTGRLVAERLIGLVLASIGTQFVLDGAREAFSR
jgi:multiple antibiotic resistance protein